MISLNELIIRDNGICWLCKNICIRESATRDHIIPYSNGGPNAAANLKLAHRECNEKRSNENLISRKEKILIILECQHNRCANCAQILDTQHMRIDDSARALRLVCRSKCVRPEKIVIPRQKTVQIPGPSIRNDLLVKQGNSCYECDGSINRRNSHKFKFNCDIGHSMENTYLVCTKCSFEKRNDVHQG